MRQRLVKLRDELPQALRTLITDEVTAQVELTDHFTILEESAQLFNVLVSQVLIFRLNNIWTVDSPGLER